MANRLRLQSSFLKRQKNYTTPWLKNALKSIGVSTSHVLQEYAPNVYDVASSGIKTTQSLVNSMRRNRTNTNRIDSTLKQNKYLRITNEFIKNAIADLKSGNFNNTERAALSTTESGFTFGDEDAVSAGISDTKSAVISLADQQRKSQETTLRMEKAKMDAFVSISSAQMQQIGSLGAEISAHLTNITNNLNALVSFQNENMNAFIRASLAYYDAMGQHMTQQDNSKTSGSYANQKDGIQSIFSGVNGGFNLSAYKKYVKNQIKNSKTLGPLAMLLDEDTLTEMARNPIGLGSEMIIKWMMPKFLESSMKTLETTYNNFMPTMLNRIAEWADDQTASTLKRFIGETFGVKAQSKTSLKGANINTKPVPFDGETKHAITQVITKELSLQTRYLYILAKNVDRKQAKAAAGEASFFDYQAGRFDKRKNINKNIAKRYDDAIYNSFIGSNFGSAMSELSTKQESDQAKQRVEKSLRKLFRGIEQYNGHLSLEQVISIARASDGDPAIQDMLERHIRSMAQNNQGAFYNLTSAKLNATNASNTFFNQMREHPELFQLFGSAWQDPATGEFTEFGREVAMAILDGKDPREVFFGSKKPKRTTGRVNTNVGGFDTPSDQTPKTGFEKFIHGTVGRASRMMNSIMGGASVADVFGNEIKNIGNSIMVKLFGTDDGSGKRSGGLLSNVINTVKDKTHDIFGALGNHFFGAGYTKSDGTKVKERKNSIIGVVKSAILGKEGEDGKRRGGLVGSLKGLLKKGSESLREGLSRFSAMLFGDQETGSKGLIRGVRDSFIEGYKKAGGKTGKGGLLTSQEKKSLALTGVSTATGGLLGSIVGGPIVGALVGLGVSIKAQGGKFSEMLFGKEGGLTVGDKKIKKEGLFGRFKNILKANVIQPLMDKVQYVAKDMLNTIQYNVVAPFKYVGMKLSNVLGKFVGKIASGGKTLLGSIVGGIGRGIAHAFGPVTKMLGGALSKIIGVKGGLTKALISVPGAFIKTIVQVSGIGAFIKKKLNKVGSFFKGIGKGIKTGVSNLFGLASSMVRDTFNLIGMGAKKLGQGFSWIADKLGVSDKLKSVKEKISSKASEFKSKFYKNLGGIYAEYAADEEGRKKAKKDLNEWKFERKRINKNNRLIAKWSKGQFSEDSDVARQWVAENLGPQYLRQLEGGSADDFKRQQMIKQGKASTIQGMTAEQIKNANPKDLDPVSRIYRWLVKHEQGLTGNETDGEGGKLFKGRGPSEGEFRQVKKGDKTTYQEFSGGEWRDISQADYELLRARKENEMNGEKSFADKVADFFGLNTEKSIVEQRHQDYLDSKIGGNTKYALRKMAGKKGIDPEEYKEYLKANKMISDEQVGKGGRGIIRRYGGFGATVGNLALSSTDNRANFHIVGEDIEDASRTKRGISTSIDAQFDDTKEGQKKATVEKAKIQKEKIVDINQDRYNSVREASKTAEEVKAAKEAEEEKQRQIEHDRRVEEGLGVADNGKPGKEKKESFLSKLASGFTSIFSKKGLITGLLLAAAPMIISHLPQIISGVGSVVGGIFDFFKEHGSDIIDGIKNIASVVGNIAVGLGKVVGGAFDVITGGKKNTDTTGSWDANGNYNAQWGTHTNGDVSAKEQYDNGLDYMFSTKNGGGQAHDTRVANNWKALALAAMFPKATLKQILGVTKAGLKVGKGLSGIASHLPFVGKFFKVGGGLASGAEKVIEGGEKVGSKIGKKASDYFLSKYHYKNAGGAEAYGSYKDYLKTVERAHIDNRIEDAMESGGEIAEKLHQLDASPAILDEDDFYTQASKILDGVDDTAADVASTMAKTDADEKFFAKITRKIKDFFKNIGNKIGEKFGKLGAKMGEKLEGTVLGKVFTKMKQGWDDLSGKIGAKIAGVTVKEGAKTVIAVVSVGLGAVNGWTAAKKVFYTDYPDGLMRTICTAWGAAMNGIPGLGIIEMILDLVYTFCSDVADWRHVWAVNFYKFIKMITGQGAEGEATIAKIEKEAGEEYQLYAEREVKKRYELEKASGNIGEDVTFDQFKEGVANGTYDANYSSMLDYQAETRGSLADVAIDTFKTGWQDNIKGTIVNSFVGRKIFIDKDNGNKYVKQNDGTYLVYDKKGTLISNTALTEEDVQKRNIEESTEKTVTSAQYAADAAAGKFKSNAEMIRYYQGQGMILDADTFKSGGQYNARKTYRDVINAWITNALLQLTHDDSNPFYLYFDPEKIDFTKPNVADEVCADIMIAYGAMPTLEKTADGKYVAKVMISDENANDIAKDLARDKSKYVVIDVDNQKDAAIDLEKATASGNAANYVKESQVAEKLRQTLATNFKREALGALAYTWRGETTDAMKIRNREYNETEYLDKADQWLKSMGYNDYSELLNLYNTDKEKFLALVNSAGESSWLTNYDTLLKGGGGNRRSRLGGHGTLNGSTYYSQTDSRWANLGYNTGSDNATMSDSGCGPTAFAMAASDVTGTNISPVSMANLAKATGNRDDTGTNWNFVNDAAGAMGLSSTQALNPSAGYISSQLDAGNPVILSGAKGGYGRFGGYGRSAYTSAGHYVVAVGKDANGNVIINDPRGTGYSGSYDLNQLASETGSAWTLGGRGTTTVGGITVRTTDDMYAKAKAYTSGSSTSGTAKKSSSGGNYYLPSSVTNDPNFRAANPDYNSVTGTNDGMLNAESWMAIVKEVKKAMAQASGTYSQSGYCDINVGGISIHARTDCSGFVSACLIAAGLIPNGTMLSSRAITDKNNQTLLNAKLTPMDWTSWEDCRHGDIMALNGHTEIYDQRESSGRVLVYNYGSNSSASKAESTPSSKSGYTTIWRVGGVAAATISARLLNGGSMSGQGISGNFGSYDSAGRPIDNSSTTGGASVSSTGASNDDNRGIWAKIKAAVSNAFTGIFDGALSGKTDTPVQYDDSEPGSTSTTGTTGGSGGFGRGIRGGRGKRRGGRGTTTVGGITVRTTDDMYNNAKAYTTQRDNLAAAVANAKANPQTWYAGSDIVNNDNFRAANPDYNSVTGTNDAAMNAEAWMSVVKAVKKAMSQASGKYNQSGSCDINVGGIAIHARTDCSGFVSACLIAAGLIPNGTMMTSASFNDKTNQTLLSGNLTPLDGASGYTHGDILAKNGHVEIYDSKDSYGRIMVYNYGSDASASQAGPTPSSGGSYTTIWRINGSSAATVSARLLNGGSTNGQGISGSNFGSYDATGKPIDGGATADAGAAAAAGAPAFQDNRSIWDKLSTGLSNAVQDIFDSALTGKTDTPVQWDDGSAALAAAAGATVTNPGAITATVPGSAGTDVAGAAAAGPTGGTTTVTSDAQPTNATDNGAKVWNYFVGKGMTKAGVAGLMGNLYQESGWNPVNLQNSYEKSLGYSDSSYTNAVDSGSYGNFVNDAAGYGLAQWTWSGRKQNLLDYARQRGTSIGDMNMQLDFLDQEMKTKYPGVYQTLMSTNDLHEASTKVLYDFENPDQKEKHDPERYQFAQNALSMYGGGAGRGPRGGFGKRHTGGFGFGHSKYIAKRGGTGRRRPSYGGMGEGDMVVDQGVAAASISNTNAETDRDANYYTQGMATNADLFQLVSDLRKLVAEIAANTSNMNGNTANISSYLQEHPWPKTINVSGGSSSDDYSSDEGGGFGKGGGKKVPQKPKGSGTTHMRESTRADVLALKYAKGGY